MRMFLCIGIVLFAMPVMTLAQDTAISLLPQSIEDSSYSVANFDTLGNDTTSDTVRYEADIIEYEINKRIIFLHENAIVRYGNMTLYADSIHFLLDDQMLFASGHPQLIEGSDTVTGEHMVYNMKDRRGKVRYGVAHSSDQRYTGATISRSDNNVVYIKDGTYTTCEHTHDPHYYFYGHYIKVIPGDKAISSPIVLNIGGTPVIVLPYFITPLEKGRQSGWLNPKFGGNILAGAGYVDNVGYYWAPNDYTDFKLAAKITEFQNFLFTAKANYALRYWFNGSLSGRYSLKNFYTGQSKEWGINYMHNQYLMPDNSLQLYGKGSIVSGSTFYRNSSEDTTEILKQDVNADLTLSKTFKRIGANASINWNRRHSFKNDDVTMALPSLNFNLNSRPLINRIDEIIKATPEKKWIPNPKYSYSVNANRFYNYNKINKDSTLFDHAGLYQRFSITAPMTIFKYFELRPNFNISHSIFDAFVDTVADTTYNVVAIYDTVLINESDYYTIIADTIIFNGDTMVVCSTSWTLDTTITNAIITRDSVDWSFGKVNTYNLNFGVSISTKLYGIFPIKLFGFKGIRHTFTPSISFTYAPQNRQLDRKFPRINVSAPQQSDTSATVGISIGNIFQGKRKLKNHNNPNEENDKTFSIFSATIGTGYDFMKDSLNMSDINIGGGIAQDNNLINLSYNTRFHPYTINNDFDFTPELMLLSLSFSPKFGSISGNLWGGDLIIYNDLHTKDYMKGYTIKKMPDWSISLRPSYSIIKTKKKVNDDFLTTKTYIFSTNARINITHKWSIAWSSYYDFTENKFQNHSFNFRCDLECWELKFDWQPIGYNKGYFYFIIKIKKHPEIKWEQRS